VSPTLTLSAPSAVPLFPMPLSPRAPASTAPSSAQPRAAYTRDAALYDQRTAAYQRFRDEAAQSLPLRAGNVVLDVGCGTGLCFAPLAQRVGPDGAIVGIDESPDMIALARDRVTRHGWHNVSLVESSVAGADIPVIADAAIFCAVHDVLRSPAALRRVLQHLRPGAWVAATGGKWAPPWMMALNPHIRALHEPYVRSFEGFDRPWSHLERLLDGVRVVETAFGAGYLVLGRTRPSCTAVATSTPWRSKMRPIDRPRAPEADGDTWSYSSHSSARNGR
jgi:SAM-dependent methyltransferase